MKQKMIKKLLKEAAGKDCSKCRRGQIIYCFSRSVKLTKNHTDSKLRTQVTLVNLFWDTLENRPETLLTLFPYFATVCGNRENNKDTAKVDWSLVN